MGEGSVGVSLQPLHADVFVADDAAGVVGLEGEGAFVEFAGELRAGLLAGGFGVFHHGLAINLHGDLVALHDDVLSPPLVILGGGFLDVHDVVAMMVMFGSVLSA